MLLMLASYCHTFSACFVGSETNKEYVNLVKGDKVFYDARRAAMNRDRAEVPAMLEQLTCRCIEVGYIDSRLIFGR